MAKEHPRSYPLEFRQNIIDLARAGKKLDELATQFDLAPQTVRNWVKQADVDGGQRSDGLTTTERDELAKLRKENRQLKVEREILSKAAADSRGRRNTRPMIENGGVDYGRAWASRSVIERESRGVEAVEAWRIA